MSDQVVVIEGTPPSPVVEVHEAAAQVTVVEVVAAGPSGAPGKNGAPGAAGADGSALGAYFHLQQDPSTVWDIEHRLGYDPAATRVLDVYGDDWWPLSVTYPDPGQLMRLTFPDSISGTARIS